MVNHPVSLVLTATPQAAGTILESAGTRHHAPRAKRRNSCSATGACNKLPALNTEI